MGRGQEHGAVYAHALLFRAGGINSGMFLTLPNPGAIHMKPTLWIRARMFKHTPYAGSLKERSMHMIYDDEVTKRDWYMFRRGEMSEYIRNHGNIHLDLYQKLYQWVETGHSIHENPWGIRNPKSNLPCDYITAMEIFYNK